MLRILVVTAFVAILGALAGGAFRVGESTPPADGLAQNFIVNSTADPGNGLCDPSPGECTLREAIDAANMTVSAQIMFDIGGCPPACTIELESELPYVTAEATAIDGGTEPDFEGDPIVVIDGAMVSGPQGIALLANDASVSRLVFRNMDVGINSVGLSPYTGRSVVGNVVENTSGNGIGVYGTDSTIRDNVLRSIGDDGIAGNYGNEPNLTITGNSITDVGGFGIYVTPSSATISGNTVLRTEENGIHASVSNSTGLLIMNDNAVSEANGAGVVASTDGAANVSNNVALDNGSAGIAVSAAGGSTVSGNTSRRNGSGTTGPQGGFDPLTELGGAAVAGGPTTISDNTLSDNVGHGIDVSGSATGSVIGGEGGENTITGNGGAGIVIREQATGVEIRANEISGNGGLGIDLELLGPGVNDPQDGDGGANNGQNYPELSAAVAGSLTIAGSLDSRPERTFRIDFYASDTCDDEGFGEGASHVGSTQITTGPDGLAPFQAKLDSDVPGGTQVTATATILDGGETSEFSECVTVAGETTPTPTPSNTPSATATATPGPTVTPTPGPSATPGPSGAQGDVDCDGDVDTVDALKVLRHVASLGVAQTEPCDDIGTGLARVTPAGEFTAVGDVDCDLDVDSVDALKILRHVASLPVQQTEPCVNIGQ